MPEPARGTISLEVSEEFPALELLYVATGGGNTRSPREIRNRMKEASDRVRVAGAPALRQARVPSAYRAFYRQLGTDPDVVLSPIDVVLRERLRAGRFRTRGRVRDAMLLASVETHVPMWAMSADELVADIGVRATEGGETLATGDGEQELPAGQLVVADAVAPRAALLEPVPEPVAVTKDTRHTVVYCLVVADVPRLVVHEALHLCEVALETR